MFLESYVLRVLCSYSPSVLEARNKFEQGKNDAKKQAEEKARFKSYQTNNFLKKKFEKNRDALTVLAPSCPVL